MIALARHGRAGLIYNVGTGSSRRVGEGLDRLIQMSGRHVKVSIDPVLESRRGVADSRADIELVTGHTGWQPKIPFERSLDDLWGEFESAVTCPAHRPYKGGVSACLPCAATVYDGINDLTRNEKQQIGAAKRAQAQAPALIAVAKYNRAE